MVVNNATARALLLIEMAICDQVSQVSEVDTLVRIPSQMIVSVPKKCMIRFMTDGATSLCHCGPEYDAKGIHHQS